MRGLKKIWGTPVKNKKMRDWIVWTQENNELVNMWLVKNYQTFCEINFFFNFCIYKMYLLSGEGYKNAGVHILIIKKLGKFGQAWKMYKMFTNMSDLILKEIYGIYEWNKKPYERAN